MSISRFTVIFSLFIVLNLVYQPAHAEEASTPSGSPASINEVTTNLRERLKEALDKDQPESDGPRAYVGVVKDIIKNTIILDDKETRRSIALADEVEILRSPGSSTIKLENIQIDDHIIAMGYPLAKNELSGKRLIVSASPFTTPEKLAGLGTVESIGRYSFTIQTLAGDELELFFTKNTIYKSPKEQLDFSDITEGDQIIFTAGKDKDDDWSATQVMRVKSNPIPSPSPEI